MAPGTSKSFYEEVWRHVANRVKELRQTLPGGMTPDTWEKAKEKAKAEFEESREARNVPFNLARLSDPGRAAIPEDLLEMSKVRKSGKYHFWDQNKNWPWVPKMWPRGKNVPLAMFTPDIDKEGPLEHYGHCSVIAGFFWAMAEATKNPTWNSLLPAFENLMVNARADYVLIDDASEVDILAFNAIEANEEARENDGFTGVRKALLVSYAVKQVKKAKQGGKVQDQEVADWLGQHIKFHDRREIPSANVCRDLSTVAQDFLQNKRAFAAYQEAEAEWGRETWFDDYSKLLFLIKQGHSADELAFIVEFLLAEMIATSPAPKRPENLPMSKLKADASPVYIARASRAAVRQLTCVKRPPSWAPFTDLVADLCRPTRFRQLFPPGGQTPESTTKLLTNCPSSLTRAIEIARAIHERHKPWTEQVKGFFNKTKLRVAPEAKIQEWLESFTEWAKFLEARCLESGTEPPQERKGVTNATDAGETAPEKGDEAKGRARPATLQAVDDDVRAKARGVYTEPGVVILKPDRWNRAALQVAMQMQVLPEDQGPFCAFFFCDSDREARVHPGQNKCLRHAPLIKGHLLSFCEGVAAIMKAGRDAVIIGAGRALGNEEKIADVVGSMRWSSEQVDLVTNRAEYNEFVKSGSPQKKRRVHRGLNTNKLKQKFWICWKDGEEGEALQVKSGMRFFVDRGSPIANDCMLDVPQVQLHEIFAVTREEKDKALSAFGPGRIPEADEGSDGQAEDCDVLVCPRPIRKAANVIDV